MDLFAIFGVIFLGFSFICLVLGKIEITFKGKVGAGIVSFLVAYVLYKFFWGLFEHFWFIIFIYVLLGIGLIIYQIRQWYKNEKRIEEIIEEIIDLNIGGIFALALALVGVIFLKISC